MLAYANVFNAPICDVGLNQTEHLLSRRRDLDEDTVVDLEETEKLERLALLWVDLVDTLDSDDECELWLSWHVVAALGLGYTGKSDLLTLCIAVLLDV